jgi:hypothetical protein
MSDAISYPDIVARCDKCGKGFVAVNPERQKDGVPCPYQYGKCGGTVRMLAAPEPSPYTPQETKPPRFREDRP